MWRLVRKALRTSNAPESGGGMADAGEHPSRGRLGANAGFLDQRALDRLKVNTTCEVPPAVGSVSSSPTSRKFEDEYSIGNELGRGAFGTVYTAYDKRFGGAYAVKCMEKHLLLRQSSRSLGRVRDEIRALGALRHPNIIGMHDVFETDDQLFILMEKADGGELFDRIVSCGAFEVCRLPTDYATYARVVCSPRVFRVSCVSCASRRRSTRATCRTNSSPSSTSCMSAPSSTETSNPRTCCSART